MKKKKVSVWAKELQQLKRFCLVLDSTQFSGTALIFLGREKQTKKWPNIKKTAVVSSLQIVYDEGPLYVFAKSEDVRAQWINKLKESKNFSQVFSLYISQHIKTRARMHI